MQFSCAKNKSQVHIKGTTQMTEYYGIFCNGQEMECPSEISETRKKAQ